MGSPLRLAGRRIDVTAAALGAATVALRVPRALGDGLWQDEVASARILREPTFGRMLGHVARTESTPPLWYALGWAAHRAGVGIVDLRLLSALFDGVFVALVVVLARRVLPPVPSALAGVLVAVGGNFAFAGRELRAYMLLALLAIALALLLDRRKPGPALAAVVCAGVLTHYFFLFTVVAGLAWLWLDPSTRETRLRATGWIALGLAGAAPWLPWALRQYRQDRYSWIGPFDGSVVAGTPLRLFTPFVHVEALVVAAALLAAAGALRLARTPTGRLVAALAFGPWLLASVLWAVGIRIYAQRNLIEIGAFLAVAAAAALRGWLPVAAVAAAAVCSYTWLQLQPQVPYAGIASTLVAEGWRPSDPVLVFGSPYALRSPLEWYLPRNPSLAIVRGPDRCREAFVVAGPRRARVLADDLAHPRRVGAFVVARAHLDETLRDSSLLAAPSARCAIPA
jgi:dolichyl-phosphate-mannose-protein mannosyltransferase